MGRPFRILSFDGGGICGLYSIGLLERLLTHHPTLLDQVDLLAGTSTGGLIALCLAAGHKPAFIRRLYMDRSPEIFRRSWWSCFGLFGAKYRNAGLIRACKDAFGDLQLGDLAKTVVIPAFDLKSEGSPDNPSWRTKFFHNFDDTPINRYLTESVADVAIRTASAPTFFPTYQGYCDGGVACNDPSVIAISMAVAKAGADLKDIRLLSIGTGGQVRYVDGQNLPWGGAEWAKPIISIFMDAMVLVSDYAAKGLLGENYFRIDPIIPDVDMDDLSRRQELLDEARSCDLTDCNDFLRNTFLTP